MFFLRSLLYLTLTLELLTFISVATDQNECQKNTSNNCSTNAVCKNVTGSYKCVCNTGYEGNGTICNDIDECLNFTLNKCSNIADCKNTTGCFNCKVGFKGNCTTYIDECKNSTWNDCSKEADCKNTDGGFNCTCKKGFEGNGTTCADIDECKNSTWNDCSKDADCKNTDGGFNCTCKKGFEGNGTTCADIDECKNSTWNDCSKEADCKNTDGGFNCTCKKGFEGNGTTCADINECKNSTWNDCSKEADCKNTDGGFNCTCKKGFEGNGTTCADINECKNSTWNDCSKDADCKNTDGGFNCTCKKGFEGNGTTCADIDECKNSTWNDCSKEADCKNTDGGFNCTCKKGFEGNGTTCTDIDECQNSTWNDCSKEADCKNTDGGFNCTCKKGFEGNGKTCTDIDECQNSTLYSCQPNKSCKNKNGSYECVCNPGYETNGTICIDIDECLNSTQNNCSKNAKCKNTPGGFICNCMVGFKGNGITCTDINECKNSTQNDCSKDADCINTDGGFNCTCKKGFEGNGKNCTDIDECKHSAQNNCSSNADCKNTVGDYKCVCKSGFEENDKDCIDIDECIFPDQNNCSSLAKCTNTIGSYSCECIKGYKKNGTICEDIDECQNGTASCHPKADCKNNNGSYKCTCPKGYRGNGKQCNEITLFDYTSAITINKQDKMYGPYDMDSFIYAFDRIFSTVYVSQNGYISLGSDPQIQAQPLTNYSFPKKVVIFAPFWTALDLSAKGKIFIDNYKICNPKDQQKLTEIGESIGNFMARRALVVTWENVSPYPASEFGNETITFQAVLASNETQLYILFNYDTEKINLNEEANGRQIIIGYLAGKGQFTSLPPDGKIFEWLKTSSNDLTGRRFIQNVGNNKANSMTCLDWFCENKETLATTAATPCPCTKQQAEQDYRFQLKKDCYETVFAQNDIMQTCCYDAKWGALLIGHPGGGHMYNKNASVKTGQNLCCKNYNFCNLVYDVYPSHNCTGYTVPTKVLIWNPLIFNFATGGESVIFYGSGEYNLINTKRFKLQARIELENNQVTPAILSNVPVYTAFAIEVDKEKFVFKKNGNRIESLSKTPGDITPTEKLVRTPTMQAKVVLNGYYLGVTLFVSASEKLTQLGLMSGTLQNGTILDKSLAENIYKTFKDWKVSNQNDSLFSHVPAKNSSTINTDQVSLKLFEEINANLTKLLKDNINQSTSQCEKKRHCEMELLLNKKVTILDAEKMEVKNQEILKNFPPVFKSTSQAILAYKSISMEVQAEDPENKNSTITLDTQLKANTYQFGQNRFNWTPNSSQKLIPGYIKFFAHDDYNATTLYWPEVFFCTCKNRSECKESAMYNKYRLRFSSLENNKETTARMYLLPCDCSEGFTGNQCEIPVDRCTETTCFPNVKCNASKSDNPCGPCPSGMEGNGIKCYDINQCSKNVCSQECKDNLGSGYICSCRTGYKLADDKKTCLDINECLGANNCTNEQYCENKDGGFSCKCNPGYLQNDTECISLKGKTKLSGSLVFASLPNTEQSWSEDLENSSSQHFKQLAKIFKDSLKDILPKKVDSLEVTSFEKFSSQQKRKKRNTSPSSIQGNYEVIGTNINATELEKSLKSQCQSTYCKIGNLRGISQKLISLQEASLCPNSPCDPVSTYCVNKNGYQCHCKAGFEYWAQYNNIRCKDIDECAKMPSPCGSATCNNTMGSFTCNCDFGLVFSSKDKKCVDVCSNNVCNQGICIRNANDFRCSCKAGWIGERCNEKDKERDQMKINLIIVGSVLGSICFLLFLVIIIGCCRSRSEKSEPSRYYTSETPWHGLPRAHLRDLETNENGSRLDLTKNSNQYDSLPGMLNPAFDPDDTSVNRC